MYHWKCSFSEEIYPIVYAVIVNIWGDYSTFLEDLEAIDWFSSWLLLKNNNFDIFHLNLMQQGWFTRIFELQLIILSKQFRH